MALPAAATAVIEEEAGAGTGAARALLKEARKEDVTNDLRLLKEDERTVTGIERGLVFWIAT